MTDPNTPDSPPVNLPEAGAAAAPKRRRRRPAARDAGPDSGQQFVEPGPESHSTERSGAERSESMAGVAGEARSAGGEAGGEGGGEGGGSSNADGPGAVGEDGLGSADGRRKRHRPRRRNRRSGQRPSEGETQAAPALALPQMLPAGDANEWFDAVISGAYDSDEAAQAPARSAAPVAEVDIVLPGLAGEEQVPAEVLSLEAAQGTSPAAGGESAQPLPSEVAYADGAAEAPGGDAAVSHPMEHGQAYSADAVAFDSWPRGRGPRPAAPGDAERRVLLPEPEAPKLQKVLAQAGVGSRRDLEAIIASGRVQVNGQPAHTGQRIMQGDRVTVDGKPVRLRIQPLPARVLAYHKPVGEVVTHDDPQARPTVFRRLPRLAQGKWQSVGRLDINTEGLLLFTNSGDLANRLMHPRFGVEREYAVRVLGTVNPASLDALRAGVQLEDGVARFEYLEEEGGEGANRWFRVLLREGRNRVVRRLFESQNLTVSRLMRVRFGIVAVPPRVKRGQFMELASDDVGQLLAWAASPEQAESPPMLPSAATEHSRPRRSSPPRQPSPK